MRDRDITCPKCGYHSGDAWVQCNGRCPMPMSPHFDPTCPAEPAAPAVDDADLREDQEVPF